MKTYLRHLAIPLVSAILAGCASFSAYEPQRELLGKSRVDVTLAMGPPAAEQIIEGGCRLVYPRGPFGRHTYMVTLDRDGKVTGWEQVLTEENFIKILPGMTAAQVEALIGPSFVKTQLARKRGEFWSYRFHSPFCIWFEVEFDIDGKVRSAGYGVPPECRAERRGL